MYSLLLLILKTSTSCHTWHALDRTVQRELKRKRSEFILIDQKGFCWLDLHMQPLVHGARYFSNISLKLQHSVQSNRNNIACAVDNDFQNFVKFCLFFEIAFSI